MSVIDGTIKGITLVNSSKGVNMKDNEKTYLVTADFAAYTGASDSGRLDEIATAIQDQVRNGKTVTLRAAHGCGPGYDNTGASVYFGAMTVSSGDLTFSLTAVDRSTEVTSFTTATGVSALVTVTES